MDERPIVLAVDDAPENLAFITAILRDTYRIKVANSGARALDIARGHEQIDLILLDVIMPGLDGYQTLTELREDPKTAAIPVIFLTGKTEAEDEWRGLEMGAVDYVTKPIVPPVLLARVRNHLALKQARDFLKNENAYLESEVRRRTQRMTRLQDVTIIAMAMLAETRDFETGNHIQRTQSYVRVLAERLQQDPRYAAQLSNEAIETITKSAALHDIGKVGIPDRILLKPGRYEPDEFEVMKKHTQIGHDAILRAERVLGTEDSFLAIAREIAHGHHEKWDGSGYPQGLAGEAIPLSARLMALADVYDALVSRRVYKEGVPHAKAVEIIAEGRGRHFDPEITDLFLAIEDEILGIAQKLADSDNSLTEKKTYYESAGVDL